MSYPLHKRLGGGASRTVRTEGGLWGLELAAAEPDRTLSRARDTQNLIWEGDALVRRAGYRRVTALTGTVHGIYGYKERLLVHAGDTLYDCTDGLRPIGSLPDAPSTGVIRRQQVTVRRCTDPLLWRWERQVTEADLLFLATGQGLWFFDGEAVRSAADPHWGESLYALYKEGVVPEFYATVPHGVVGKAPHHGGGDRDPRGDNRLSQFRTESYYLPSEETVAHLVTSCMTKDFNIAVPAEVELRDAEGIWRCWASDKFTMNPSNYPERPMNIGFLQVKGGMDITLTDGVVTAVGTGEHKIAADGFDNLRITYAVMREPPAELNGATVMGLYGAGGTDDVLFLGGSAAAPGEDAYSVAGDFLCFYQTATERLGNVTTPITGYCRLSDGRMAVLKDDPGSSTVYFRSHGTVELGMTLAGEPYTVDVFPSKTGAQVEGCVSARSVGAAGNEPIFLARTGLYGVRSVSNELTDLNETVRRSIPIDPLLTTLDVGLLRSVCWQNYYILSFGSLLFVTDGRRDGKGQLRFMKWRTAHPVTALGVVKGRLYLGSEGGLYQYGGEDDAGTPIEAYWRTPAAEGGDGRNLLLRRLWVGVSPAYGARLSARLWRDRTPLALPKVSLHRLNFGEVDFADFSFDGTEEARWLPLMRSTARGAALGVEVDLSRAPGVKLWGFRMVYEKGGKMI